MAKPIFLLIVVWKQMQLQRIYLIHIISKYHLRIVQCNKRWIKEFYCRGATFQVILWAVILVCIYRAI